MRRQRICPRDPVGLSIESAAAFLEVSPDLFQRAVDDGLMPAPRKLFGRLIWDADEIQTAFRRLPKKGGKPDERDGPSKWDDVEA